MEGSDWEYNAPQEWIDFNSVDVHNLDDQADTWFDEQANAEENFYSMPDTFAANNNEESEADKSVYFDSADGEASTSQPPPTKRQRRSARVSTDSVMSMSSTVSAPPGARGATSWNAKNQPQAGPRRSRRRSLHEARAKMRPKTPNVLRRPGRVATGKSSEELELERIEAGRKKAEQAKKQSQKSLAAIDCGSRKRTYTATQPTQPEEFHFKTDQRVKSHSMQTRQDETLKPGDFAKCLRSSKTFGSAKPPRPTVPKPFHLTQHQKNVRGSSTKNESGYSFHSDAERVFRFQKDTPERFRTRPRNDPGPQSEKPHQAPKLTMPQTPNLVSRNRKRPITVVSAAEMEEKEVEEIKRFKFRAQPVNNKIFEKELGIPKVEPKELTKPIGFDLQTEKRPLVARHPDEEEEKFEFKAHPVPRNILDGPVGIRKTVPAPVTVPASPAFALKNRLRSVQPHPPEPELEEAERIVRAKPVPHHGVGFQPKFDHRTTVPEPFSFDERDRQKLKEKEEKIHKIIEEETKPHEFHAQPIPNYEALNEQMGKAKPKPPTKPEPFHLESVQRYQQKQEEIERLREEELRELREAAQFKAKPATVINKEPFVPRRTDKPLTEINQFELNTERRAHERETYEERKHEKDVMLEQMNQERLRRQQEEEEEKLRELRQAMVHKAQPVKHYKPVAIHPSDKSLTHPQSPRFSDRIKK